MKPVIVYFISGDLDGAHVEIMESKMKDVHPDRTTNVIHVESEKEKCRILSEYNVEEMDGYTANVLWQEIEGNDETEDD